MPKPGVSNNPAGRPAGIPNKQNKTLRLLIHDFLNNNFELVQSDFLSLPPRDRVKLYVDLLHFSLPRLESIHVSESELGLDIAQLSPEAIQQLTKKIEANRPQFNVQICEQITGMEII